MKNAVLAISVFLSILVFLSIPLLQGNHPNNVAWVRPGDIIVAIFGIPMFVLALVLIVFSAVQLTSPNPQKLYIVVLVLSLCSPGYSVLNHISAASAQDDRMKGEKWLMYGAKVNPLIASYIQQNPQKVSFKNNGDVVQVEGLGSFLQRHASDIPVRGDSIIDPWGDPILIVLEHSQPGMLIAPKTSYGVWSAKGNKIALGLFEPNPHLLEVEDGQQWQVLQIPN